MGHQPMTSFKNSSKTLPHATKFSCKNFNKSSHKKDLLKNDKNVGHHTEMNP